MAVRRSERTALPDLHDILGRASATARSQERYRNVVTAKLSTWDTHTSKPALTTIHLCLGRPGSYSAEERKVSVSDSNANQAPVIQSISAPSSLNVGEQGTWSISAYDQRQAAHLLGNWGDEPFIPMASQRAQNIE